MKPFNLEPKTKSKKILSKMLDLTKFHYQNCGFYRNYLNSLEVEIDNISHIETVPYLPARFFKEFSISSSNNSVAVAKSSGTSGETSKINLNHKTMLAQSVALNSIVNSFVGSKKRPMLIIDKESVAQNKLSFNARGAAVLGFQKFGDPIYFAYDQNGEILIKSISKFYKDVSEFNSGLIFGFTSKVWESLEEIKPMIEPKKNADMLLIHGGGWKKLENLKISNKDFCDAAQDTFGSCSVHNYYGMVEQTGSIFFECEHGKMHASSFSEAIVRDVNTLEPLKHGQDGVIQVFSTLPESYPGHSILTEDFGTVYKDEKCKCGRFGTTITIHGRLPDAEIRGCSDVYN